MAIKSVIDLYAAALAAGPYLCTRLSSDRINGTTEDLDSITTSDSRKCSISADYAGPALELDSNTLWQLYTVRINIYHRLASATDERAYTEVMLETLQRLLGASAFWVVAGIYDVAQDTQGKLEIAITRAEREGNIVHFTATAGVLTTS